MQMQADSRPRPAAGIGQSRQILDRISSELDFVSAACEASIMHVGSLWCIHFTCSMCEPVTHAQRHACRDHGMHARMYAQALHEVSAQMGSSHVDSSDELPKKRQRCTKNKSRKWHMQEVTELTQRDCQCKGGGGPCFRNFKELREQLCDLRMELKQMQPEVCDLTLSNMYYGASELGVASPVHQEDRVPLSTASSDDRVDSNGSNGRVESVVGAGSESGGRVDSSSEKCEEVIQT